MIKRLLMGTLAVGLLAGSLYAFPRKILIEEFNGHG